MLEKAKITFKGLLMATGESSERNEENWRENVHLLKEYINNHEQKIGRNMDDKGHSDEVSDGRNIVIGQWKKGDPFYKRAKKIG